MNYYELTPGRAKNKDPEDLWDSPVWVAEEKLDGWRFLMHFGGHSARVYLTGRHASVDTGALAERGLNVKPLWPSEDFTSKIGYTVLDGEVLPPVGADYRDLNGIVGKTSPEKAAERIAEIGCPRYVVFDILYHDGRDVRNLAWLERRKLLEKVVYDQARPVAPMYATYTRISVVKYSYDKLELYDEISRAGGEGIILKEISEAYGVGWIKVKKTVTLDVIVTGFTEAKIGKTGKFMGLIGAARVSVYGTNGELIEVGKVSGMTDDIRRDMTEHPGDWLGRVIEVRCARFAKERLWHPRYERPRHDANPREATYRKMMADLGRVEDVPDDKQGELF